MIDSYEHGLNIARMIDSLVMQSLKEPMCLMHYEEQPCIDRALINKKLNEIVEQENIMQQETLATMQDDDEMTEYYFPVNREQRRGTESFFPVNREQRRRKKRGHRLNKLIHEIREWLRDRNYGHLLCRLYSIPTGKYASGYYSQLVLMQRQILRDEERHDQFIKCMKEAWN